MDKTNKNQMVSKTIILPKELAEKLKTYAYDEDMTFSSYIAYRLSRDTQPTEVAAVIDEMYNILNYCNGLDESAKAKLDEVSEKLWDFIK